MPLQPTGSGISLVCDICLLRADDAVRSAHDRGLRAGIPADRDPARRARPRGLRRRERPLVPRPLHPARAPARAGPPVRARPARVVRRRRGEGRRAGRRGGVPHAGAGDGPLAPAPPPRRYGPPHGGASVRRSGARAGQGGGARTPMRRASPSPVPSWSATGQPSLRGRPSPHSSRHRSAPPRPPSTASTTGAHADAVLSLLGDESTVLVQAGVDGTFVMAQSVFDAGTMIAFHANTRCARG